MTLTIKQPLSKYNLYLGLIISQMVQQCSDTAWTDVQGVSLLCDNDDHEQCQLQFGKKAPSFGPRVIISSRGISTTLLNPLGVKSCVLNIQVVYNLIERNYSTCLSSDSTTLAPPQIQYQQRNNNWTTVNNSKETVMIIYKLQFLHCYHICKMYKLLVSLILL